MLTWLSNAGLGEHANNRHRTRRKDHQGLVAAGLMTLLLIPSAKAADPLEALDADLRRCAERILPAASMVQKQVVRVISEQGWQRESTRTLYWKRFENATVKMLFEVERPLSEAGLKVLIIKSGVADPVLYVYTPDTGRARRMVGSGASNSVLGTDLTYEDALHFERFLQAGGSTRKPDRELAGHAAFVLETKPSDDSSAYSLIRTFVDKALCVPVKTEFFGSNGSLDKTLVTNRDDVKIIGERSIALSTVMYNHKLKSRSEFEVTEVALDVALADRLFTLSEIKKSN